MIRRGLIVQMNMLAESQAQEKPVSEEAIRAYYDLRRDQYTKSPEYTFTQIYFDASENQENLQEIAKRLNLEQAKPDAADLPGKQGMLQRYFEQAGAYNIDRLLGEGFTAKLDSLELQSWEGPVKSGFGWHLVYITEKSPPEPMPLDAVRDEILAELQYEEAQAAKEQFYTELRQQYDVVYEGIAKDLVND